MTIHAIDLEQADEANLTIEQKVMLLWKAIMGYGYGTGRFSASWNRFEKRRRSRCGAYGS